MKERKQERRSGQPAVFTPPPADQRRTAYERRGTVPQSPPVVREVLLHGERRKLPDAGLE